MCRSCLAPGVAPEQACSPVEPSVEFIRLHSCLATPQQFDDSWQGNGQVSGKQILQFPRQARTVVHYGALQLFGGQPQAATQVSTAQVSTVQCRSI